MNDRFFSMGIMLLFITVGVNTMITMGSQLQDTNGTPISLYLLPYISPLVSVNDIRAKAETCKVGSGELTPQATTPGSTEGFTPITCTDSGGIKLISSGISFVLNALLMLAGLELMLVAIGTYLIPIAYWFFIGIATIVALLKWGLIAYAGSQIVRSLFGRSLF